MSQTTVFSPGSFTNGELKRSELKRGGPFYQPAHWDVADVIARTTLNRVYEQLRGSAAEVEAGMRELLATLWSAKSMGDRETWGRVIQRCMAHPLRHVIHEDPFAHRCYTKPRGYAGDAPLIDYLYTRTHEHEGLGTVSEIGQRIFDFTLDISAGHAVRQRRDLMATAIDETCRSRPEARILSVACGHLREALVSSAVPAGHAKRFVALDQDRDSLAVVEQEAAHLGVTAVHDSIKAIFRGPVASEKFDLIYSTGLYDYLEDRLATRLTHRMFDLLNPGGRLIIANFVTDVACSAYMEAFLDWNLIYRDESQVRDLSRTIAADEIARSRTYFEEQRNIVFLEIWKRDDR